MQHLFHPKSWLDFLFYAKTRMDNDKPPIHPKIGIEILSVFLYNFSPGDTTNVKNINNR
jgi:hypothetical protein